jgi:hypothetical protein
MNKAPCKNCEDRYEKCHTKCERYKEFKNYRNMIHTKRKTYMPIDNLKSKYR